MIRRLALALAALALPLTAPVAAQSVQAAPADSAGDLRCAAAFAILAGRQDRGEAAAMALPALGTAGREYFVRVLAARMDADSLDRTAVAALAQGEVARIQSESAAAADPDRFFAELVNNCLPRLAIAGAAGE